MKTNEKIMLFEYYFNELSRLSDDVVGAYNDMFKYNQHRRRSDISNANPIWLYRYIVALFRYEFYRETMHNVFELLGMLKY